jgi:hypothetical protein
MCPKGRRAPGLGLRYATGIEQGDLKSGREAMSEDVILYGVGVASATELCELIRAAGLHADDPREEHGGTKQWGNHTWSEFAVYEGEEHVL